MIHIILNILGIILLLYSIYSCVKILKILGKNSTRVSWKFLCTLILFFLIGYSYHLYLILNPLTTTFHKDLLVSLIFFFGAIFVVSVLEISKNQIIMLNNEKEELIAKNSELNFISKKLKKEHKELKRTKAEALKKNKKIEETLDEFYSLNLNLKK